MQQNPTTRRARELRNTPNPAQQYLWNALKDKQLSDYKFTRQFPIGPYFADFACRQHFLAIEIDGSQHIDSAYDEGRDVFIIAQGYSILRLTSGSVLANRGAACDAILAALEGRMDNEVDSMELKFRKSSAVPLRFRRHRPWLHQSSPP